MHQRNDGIATAGNANSKEYHDGHHNHCDEPERSVAVLQHDNHDGHYRRHYHQAIKTGCHHEVQPEVASKVVMDEQPPPQMAQHHDTKEGCRPTTQTQRRCDIRRNGIAAAKQQIDAGNKCCYCRSAI